VSLPVQEFLPGGGVTADTIGVGRLCQLPNSQTNSNNGEKNILPADEFVPGLVVLSARAPALAAWLSGTEIVAVQADLRKRVLTMETDIDTQYLMAKLNAQQRIEAAAFEEAKDRLNGLHFVSVQKTEDDEPEGFWLLRELPSGI
jgi:RNA-binding protein Tab2/Atab2